MSAHRPAEQGGSPVPPVAARHGLQGLAIRPYREQDREAVVALWRECGLLRPWNDPYKDIARKLTVQRELFLVGECEGVICALSLIHI